MSVIFKLVWRYRACALPVLCGGLIAIIYLSGFHIYRDWKIPGSVKPAPESVERAPKLVEREPTDVQFLFEELVNLNLGANGMLEAVSMKNAVNWGTWNGLVAISGVLGVLIIGYVIWKAPRDWTAKSRWTLALILLALAMILCPIIVYKRGIVEKFTVTPKQFWVAISRQFTHQPARVNFINIELFVATMDFGVPLALAFASAATLWPVRELERPFATSNRVDVEDAAQYVAAQMKRLRIVLYVGAILLLITMFRHRATLNWALEYFKPAPELGKHPLFENASMLYAHLEGVVSNIVSSTSVLNTLLLAALYVPSALILQRRAVALSALAFKFEKIRPVTAIAAAKARYRTEQAKKEQAKDVNVESEDDIEYATPKQEEWMQARGLTNPFTGQLPKVAAILSPLLAGPIGELLKHIG